MTYYWLSMPSPGRHSREVPGLRTVRADRILAVAADTQWSPKDEGVRSKLVIGCDGLPEYVVRFSEKYLAELCAVLILEWLNANVFYRDRVLHLDEKLEEVAQWDAFLKSAKR